MAGVPDLKPPFFDMLPEKLLHLAWARHQFHLENLHTVCGQKLRLSSAGLPNTHQGPDFLNARLWLGAVEWRGAVELHSNSQLWYEHGHDSDPGYNQVILHVVEHSNGQPILRQDGSTIPELELGPRLYPQLAERWQQLSQHGSPILCEPLLESVQPFVLRQWLNSLAMTRLLRKAQQMDERRSSQGQDWEQCLWVALCRSMGGDVNRDAMEELAQGLPVQRLGKLAGRMTELEAVLLGRAGMLEAPPADEYSQILHEHWRHYRELWNLEPMAPSRFSYLRMRPAGFPSVRLVQLAALLHSHSPFSQLLERPLLLWEWGKALKASEYWKTHYRLGHESPARDKRLGDAMVLNLLINALLPISLAYFKSTGQEDRLQETVEQLSELPSEANSIIRQFLAVGIRTVDACESQGAIELFNTYCTQFRCLDCQIGCAVLLPKQNRGG